MAERNPVTNHRKKAPKPYPDWFWSQSGEIDSTAAFLLTRDVLRDNYGKRPVMIHFDTGVGVPLNPLYLEELCDWCGEQLWTLRTEENFAEGIEHVKTEAGEIDCSWDCVESNY